MTSKFGSAEPEVVKKARTCLNGEPHEVIMRYPECAFCGKWLGCPRCQGQGHWVKCPNCHRMTNLMPYFREIAKTPRALATDSVGVVRFTNESGCPMIVEADRIMRVCKLDEPPIKHKIRVNEIGAYLDSDGFPLYPEDWPPTVCRAE
jgi:hypothetical protein